MDFPLELANKIVQMLNQVTNNNVNFMNGHGIIIASIQKNRIGSIHEGAKKIMAGEIDELAITVEEAEKMTGAMPGYNGVVTYKDQRIGCIGLSGDPVTMKPLQYLATIIVQEEYEKYIANKNKEKTIEKIAGKIEEMSAAVEEITVGSTESLHYIKIIEEKANCAENFLKNITLVLDSVKKISDKTKLLGLNASIEAARAGNAGKGFAVVAKEIGELSANSMSALKNINIIMQEVSNSIINIAQGVRNSSESLQQQTDAIENIGLSSKEIENEIEKLLEIE